MPDPRHGRPDARVTVVQLGTDPATQDARLCHHRDAERIDVWLEDHWQPCRVLRPDERPADQQWAYVICVVPLA
jgi:hypothetical protein